MSPPWYWRAMTKAKEGASFHEEVEGGYVQSLGTKLIQQTLPTSEVVRCLRIEDSNLWER